MIDHRPIVMEFTIYTVASAVALVLDYAIYWLLVAKFGIAIGPAAAAGYVVGLLLAYVLMTFGVFARRSRPRSRLSEAALFVLSGLLGLGLTFATATLVSNLTNGNLHAAKLAAVGTSFGAVYLFRKFVVFRSFTKPG